MSDVITGIDNFESAKQISSCLSPSLNNKMLEEKSRAIEYQKEDTGLKWHFVMEPISMAI